MLYTLKHAKDLVAPFVMTGGSCPSAPEVVNRINEAQRRLLGAGRADWDQTQRHVKLCTRLGCVALPREFDSARLVGVDGSPVDLFPNSYTYLENGPGLENLSDHYGMDLEDLGDGWPTFFDVPFEDGTDFHIFFVTTDHTDSQKTVTVYGRNKDGTELLQTNGLPGLQASIRHWAGSTEGSLDSYPEPSLTVPVHQITQLVLPLARRAYLSLFAVNTTTHEMFFLSKYHPAETSPAYRRYKLLGADGTNARSVRMLCKVRHVPLVRDDDVLLIQDLDAIKIMVMAIREENAGNVTSAVTLEALANAQLAKQLANKRSADPIIHVRDSFAIGGGVNII